jgi:hypothetical protein
LKGIIFTFFAPSDEHPAESRFSGKCGRRIEFKDRMIELRSTIDVHSDEKNFYVTVVRYAFENKELVRQREWKEAIPRKFN